MSGAVGVGILGAGVISAEYLKNLQTFPDIAVQFVADHHPENARARAEQVGVSASGTLEDLLDRDDVEIVVNLTPPNAHFALTKLALEYGKHVWSEKPITTSLDEARSLLDLAGTLGRTLGIAPDTMLGSGMQSAFRQIRSGRIGNALSAWTTIQYGGPDLWHPQPAFLFQDGGGPVLDTAPYYLTTLVHVFGAASRVQAVGLRSADERVIQVGPRAGERFAVTKNTDVAALVEFADGGFASMRFSFDSAVQRLGRVEVYGSERAIRFTDPNGFGTDVRTVVAGDQDWAVEDSGAPPFGRGAGVVDMARCIRNGGRIFANAHVATHVLEIMLAIESAAEGGRPVQVSGNLELPPLLPDDWDPRESTLS